MRKPHWLDGVARVLRADTDDLRELARIGGVDPHTAYVGTRLDGTDLRGQDLRGMVEGAHRFLQSGVWPSPDRAGVGCRG